MYAITSLYDQDVTQGQVQNGDLHSVCGENNYYVPSAFNFRMPRYFFSWAIVYGYSKLEKSILYLTFFL